MIRAVHHAQITMPAGDAAEAEARAYYCALLGATETPKPESLAGRGGLWLTLGGVQVHLGVQDGVDRISSKAHVAYLVDDLSAVRHELEARGYAAEDGIQVPGYQRFESRDPFGNRIEFLERT